MGIHNIIVHEVRKEDDQAEAKIYPREEENTIDPQAKNLGKELSELFRKTGLSTGQFSGQENEDDPIPHFVSLLDKYYDSEEFINFTEFSRSATDEFKRKLDKSIKSKGGYLWFNHYTHNKEHFLSIVLLRKKNGLSISDNLTLDKIESLDLDKLHMAARINLDKWKIGGSSRYIAFCIGRAAKDVTGYFSKFIGCEIYVRAKVDTQNLILVTNDYCSKHAFSEEDSIDIKQAVFDQCIVWIKEEKPVLIENISSYLDIKFSPKEPDLFLEIAQNEPYNLTNEIPIDKRALKGLTRFSGRTKNLSLSFDSAQLNESVFYNSKRGEITITAIPPQLMKQLDNET